MLSLINAMTKVYMLIDISLSIILFRIPTLTELPMPLRKIPVCAGPQKYKGVPITEVIPKRYLGL